MWQHGHARFASTGCGDASEGVGTFNCSVGGRAAKRCSPPAGAKSSITIMTTAAWLRCG